MNNCKNCNQSCNNGDCGCIPQGMTTPNHCPADLPSCPDPSPCNETFDAQCVYYTGVGNECVGLENGQTVEESLEAISTALNPFFCLECINFALPANAATNVPLNQVITWNMVPNATCYDVYLGTSSTTLALVSLGQILTTYTPSAPLLEGQNYYWQVVPRNDAGIPKIDCPIYYFTTFKFLCTNPITYILEAIESQAGGLTDPITYLEVATSFLQNGLLLTNCDLCCPDCTETNRYVLASAEAFANYYVSVYSETCLPPCCIEIDSSLGVYTGGLAKAVEPQASTGLFQIFQTIPSPTNCCGTNFSECSQRIRTILGPDVNDIYNKFGIVEESTINGSTTLCLFADFLESLPSSWTTSEMAVFLNVFLELGLVIDCRPEGTLITNAASYVSYLELVNVDTGCLCYKPCADPLCIPVCYQVDVSASEFPGSPVTSFNCETNTNQTVLLFGGTYYICSGIIPYGPGVISTNPLPNDCAAGECIPV
jgi:hypothetical protein